SALAAGRLHPDVIGARGAARADGRLQRVASRTDHARAATRVLVADAADAPHTSRLLPALPSRPDLLGRRARGRDVPPAPQSSGPRRLRSLARRGPAACAPAARAAASVHRGGCFATGGVKRGGRATGLIMKLGGPVPLPPKRWSY